MYKYSLSLFICCIFFFIADEARAACSVGILQNFMKPNLATAIVCSVLVRASDPDPNIEIWPDPVFKTWPVPGSGLNKVDQMR